MNIARRLCSRWCVCVSLSLQALSCLPAPGHGGPQEGLEFGPLRCCYSEGLLGAFSRWVGLRVTKVLDGFGSRSGARLAQVQGEHVKQHRSAKRPKCCPPGAAPSARRRCSQIARSRCRRARSPSRVSLRGWCWQSVAVLFAPVIFLPRCTINALSEYFLLSGRRVYVTAASTTSTWRLSF